MKHYKATRLADGEVQFLCSEDDQEAPPGYPAEEWTFELLAAEPGERTTAAHNDAMAEAYALELLERQYDREAAGQMARLARQLQTMTVWQEIQRLKHMNATGHVAALTAAERRLYFPNLTALAQAYGVGLAQAATAAENRLADRVWNTAVAAAKMLKARDDVRAASTREAKLAVLPPE